jgi:hypothetical protein
LQPLAYINWKIQLIKEYLVFASSKTLSFETIEERAGDDSVGIETRLRAGRPRSLDSIPGRGKRFFSFHNVQAGSGAHPASYRGLFPPGIEKKGGGGPADHLHLPPRLMVELYLKFPHTSGMELE